MTKVGDHPVRACTVHCVWMVIPCIANEWESSSGGKVYLVTLSAHCCCTEEEEEICLAL